MDFVLMAYGLLPFALFTGNGWLLSFVAILVVWPIIAFVLGPILPPRR